MAEMDATYAKVVAKAWTDKAFKQRLLSNPAAVLKEEGVEVPGGVTLEVVENTDKHMYLVLPAQPGKDELSDEDLDKVAAGGLTGDILKCVCGGDFSAGCIRCF